MPPEGLEAATQVVVPEDLPRPTRAERIALLFATHPDWAALQRTDALAGWCAEVTADLERLYRDIFRVWGSVEMLDRDPSNGKFDVVGFGVDDPVRTHWWCETIDGEIVDPTRDQFTGRIEYLRWHRWHEDRIEEPPRLDLDALAGAPADEERGEQGDEDVG